MGTKRPSLDDLRLRMNESTARKNEHLFNNGGEKKTSNRVAHSAANVEQDSGNGTIPKEGTPRFVSQVRVHFHSRRHRKVDPDNLCGKYILDGIVRTGKVLADDSASEVKEVTHEQEKIPKSEAESTIITIEEV